MKKKVAKKKLFFKTKTWNLSMTVAIVAVMTSAAFGVSFGPSLLVDTPSVQGVTTLPKCPIVFSHAGAASFAPMDSKPAVLKAIEQGATGIEGNLRFSSNGQPIMFHDVTTWGLNKLTNDPYRDADGYGHAVSKLTWTQLQALDLSQPEKFGTKYKGTKILTFYQWLGTFKPRMAMIEFKVKPTSTQWNKIKSDLSSQGMTNRIVIYSTDATIVSDIHAHLPNAPYMQWGKAYDKPLVIWEQWQTALDKGIYGVMTDDVAGFRTWAAGKCTF